MAVVQVRAVAVPQCCAGLLPAVPDVLACPVVGVGLKVLVMKVLQ